MNAQMQTPAGASRIPQMLDPGITDFQETECPKCRSMESALCSTVESAAQSRPQKRNHPRVKFLYAIVLVSSWSIVDQREGGHRQRRWLGGTDRTAGREAGDTGAQQRAAGEGGGRLRR